MDEGYNFILFPYRQYGKPGTPYLPDHSCGHVEGRTAGTVRQLYFFRVRKERKNNIIPEALTPAPDLAGYDLVFVGFPIWFNDIPAFFGSFLLRCNLREKTVIPFSTSTNSTILNSLTTLERICPDSILKYPFAHITLKRSDTSGWLSLLKTSCGAG